MAFQDTIGFIEWKVYFLSSIDRVFTALTTNEGRKSFWAESAAEKDGYIEFDILGYEMYKSEIVEIKTPNYFCIDYFGTTTEFQLTEELETRGTNLHLKAQVDNEELRKEMTAGWVSVLMAMKAYVDFGVDLRNHDIEKTWDKGYVNN